MALYLTDENGKLIQIAGILPIINDLTSDRADLALSAAQGKALKTLIDNVSINSGYDDTEIKELIFNIRSDLSNYYTKTETDSKVSAIPKFTIQVVEALPSTGISYSTIYLVLSGEEDRSLYTEYIYVDNKWEKLGEQSINLDNYVTIEKLNEVLKDYCTVTTVTELINKSLENYVTLETMNAQKYLTEIPENYVTEEKLNNKGFLTSVPEEYITNTYLEQQNYLKALPDEAVTETELDSKGFAKQEDLTTITNLTNELANIITKFKTVSLKDSGLLDMIYPVGTVQIFTNDIDPNVVYGGTWVQMKGRFLLGSGANDSNTTEDFGSCSSSYINRTLGEKGGEVKHYLSSNEMPSHNHSVHNPYTNTGANGVIIPASGGTASAWDASYSWNPTGWTGGGAAHNNMPLYTVVAMWHRTA